MTIFLIFTLLGIFIALSSKERWREYWWFAVRNPVEGLDSLLEQPAPELHPNPDKLVRTEGNKKASRFMDVGFFWEYWRLSKIERGPLKGRYWEMRIGWKFVDGNEDFVPTIQLGPKR